MVEQRIRDDKDTRLAEFPLKEFALNAAQWQTVLLAHDMIVWTHALVLDRELANAEQPVHKFGVTSRPSETD